MGEHLEKYRNCELVMIIAATGKAQEEPVVCGICGFALDEVGECPRCKLIYQEAARQIREEMLREAEGILRDEDE